MACTRRRRSNMNEEYQKFLRTLCVHENDMTDPQRNIIDDASINILEAEGRGIVQNVRRPTKDEPNLDFKDDGPGPIEFIDVKWGKRNEDFQSAAEKIK